MVKITPEEFFAAKRKPDSDSLSQIDREILGETCRLEIPFRDLSRMHETAELLRNYADLLDLYSRRSDLPPRVILFHLQTEARILNRKIRETRARRLRGDRNED